MWKNQNGSADFNQKVSKDEKVMINNFDAAYRMLNMGNQKMNYPSFRDKIDLFFIDHEFVPLLVQDNYLNMF